MTIDQEMQAGHAAQRFADAHRHLLCPPCTRDCNQGRACPAHDPLAKAITTRENILRHNWMPEWVRRSLERRNDNTEQVMRVTAADAEADKTGAELGVWLVKGVCIFASLVMAGHLIAWNWGL